MKSMKQYVLPLLFAVEIVSFAGSYLWGSHGRPLLQTLKHENNELAVTVAAMEAEIAQLQKHATAWQSNTLYKERVAREKLHMAKEGEVVYYLT